MQEYIFKFFLQEAPDDGCCENDEVHQVSNWNYLPSKNGVDSIEVVENTVYNNNATKYLYIKGNNFLDADNEIKGKLEVYYRCVSKCDLISQKTQSSLRAIQIEGFAAAISGPNNSMFIPVGETIRVQLLGGFGSVRFATSSRGSVASVFPRVASESNDYRPEMQVVGEEQVDANCFKVDKNLGEGNHIFSITINDIGPVTINFKDEAGCYVYINLYGAGNLCDHRVSSPYPEKTNYEPRSTDKHWFKEGYGIEGFQLANANNARKPCNCDFSFGDTFTKTYYLANILSGGLGSMVVYDGENFAHGTRTLNLPDIQQNKLYITHTIQKHVGEEEEIQVPEWGGNWNSRIVISEPKGSWGGHGYDSENMIPWGVGAKRERDLIEVQNLNLKFKQPTNHAPILIHVYSSDGNAVGPPNPEQVMHVKVLNGNGGDLVYTRRNGQVSSITTEEYGLPNRIVMTNDDWFVAARGFCPPSDGPGLDGLRQMDQEAIFKEDEYFPVSLRKLNDEGHESTTPILNNNNSWYFAPTDVGRPTDLKIRDNIVRSPDLDQLPPQRQSQAQFQVGPGSQDVNEKNYTLTIFAYPWLFWSASMVDAFPPHKECIKAHEVQYFKNGDFYDNVQKETLGNHKHDPEIDEPYQGYDKEGLTAQPRGSWCIQNNTFKVQLNDKLPVFEVDGKPKIIWNKKDDKIISAEKIINDKRSYKFINWGVDAGSHLINYFR